MRFYIFLFLPFFLYAEEFILYKKPQEKQFFIPIVDTYILQFDAKSQTCKLSKNDEIIELFDTRFERKSPPSTSYKCSAFIKENYGSCKVLSTLRLSAQFLSFGRYSKTNLLFAFNIDYNKLDSYMKIECIK